ncbi:MAG: 4-hydroxy-tetrahydrodipicolinate synthase [Clostridia bacterium]|nr:4-hydroxy-tetrahydrodipicolinate synthase [Clostridia bacterium]
MKKQVIFEGVGTALVTPFTDGKIDYSSLGGLIDIQLEAGIDALVIGGTTAEAATLSDEERYDLFRYAKDRIAGRTRLIFGTGTNDTRLAVRHTEFASSLGCDGVLLVTPYYNRGTREGIIRHYLTLADASGVPILLYNVPSRTGVNLDTEILARLAECEKIVGIKEASDSLDRLTSIAALGEELWLYSGNDSQIYPTLALGGRGVISVVSNLYPRATMEICKLFFAKREAESLALQQRMMPVINSLFLETNPAPIKFALSERGLCRPDMRLPMWLPTEACQKRVIRAIREFTEE